ncbi:WD repeat-containing protein 18 [Dissostichus eleginoides]|uniref:WD repeat-containing protein 18 n=1 Tax=Dissostichus eleginoides TaxID=100907 RepID=A0AAD9FDT2_DISEL|nr:WD repeat-containing protein 18 [Dissostichus eleginoides]
MAAPLEVIVSSDSGSQMWNSTVFDLLSGSSLLSYRGGSSSARGLTLLSGGYLLCAQLGKNFINVWEIQRKDQLQQKIVCPGVITCLTASPDGLFLAAGVAEGIYLWEVSTGKLLSVLNRHYQDVTCLKFTDDSSHFISGGKDNMALVWKPRHILSRHSLPITDLHCGLMGAQARVATASLDQTVKVWELSSGELLLSVLFDVEIMSVIFDPSEYFLFCGGSDGNIFQVSLCSQPSMFPVYIPTCYFLFTPTSSILHPHLLLPPSFTPTSSFLHPSSFTPTSFFLLPPSFTPTSSLLHPSSFTPTSSFLLPPSSILHPHLLLPPSFTPTSSFLLPPSSILQLHPPPHSLSREKSFQSDSDGDTTFKGHRNLVTCLSVSMDGTLLLSGSHDETVRLWDIQSKQSIRSLAHKGDDNPSSGWTRPRHVFSDERKASSSVTQLLKPIRLSGFSCMLGNTRETSTVLALLILKSQQKHLLQNSEQLGGPVTNAVIMAAPANMFLPDSRPAVPLPRFSRHLQASEGAGPQRCVRPALYTQEVELTYMQKADRLNLLMNAVTDKSVFGDGENTKVRVSELEEEVQTLKKVNKDLYEFTSQLLTKPT